MVNSSIDKNRITKTTEFKNPTTLRFFNEGVEDQVVDTWNVKKIVFYGNRKRVYYYGTKLVNTFYSDDIVEV